MVSGEWFQLTAHHLSLTAHEVPDPPLFLHRRHRFDDARCALFEGTTGRGGTFFDQTQF